MVNILNQRSLPLVGQIIVDGKLVELNVGAGQECAKKKSSLSGA